MTLDLTGKLAGARCVLRIKTNMECYYDQAFIAVRDRSAEKALRVKSLPVARAVLGYRGYTREVSPDGEQPLFYDYDHVDPAPLARLSGKLTRFGDVAPLLQTDDDQLCLIGPGDELRVEFEAAGLAELPRGGRAATCCAASVTARTPTRSRRGATRSSRFHGAECRRTRSAGRSRVREMRRTEIVPSHLSNASRRRRASSMREAHVGGRRHE